MNWYFYASADWFGGFFTEADRRRGFDSEFPLQGPYKTFSEAKADALVYYRDISKNAHREARRVKEMTKNEVSHD